ncbi:MAG: glycosyltransferase [Lachnospiraceae bacterium]|nr:glycosyltransferase [Lachnospiraceae bacterium]
MGNSEIEKLKEELEKEKLKNMELSSRITELEDEKEEIEDSLSRIRNSKAYKLSKPLRKVRSQVKRVTQYGSVSAVKEKIKSRNLLKKRYKELGTDSFPDLMRRSEEKQKEYEKKIVISILVPLYNTPENFLKEMIESVTWQTYPYWELCLADGSDEEHSYVGEICQKYAADERIKYEKLTKNEGISGNTNECLKMATGDYIGLFDHDDILHPSALFKYREAIDEGADYIYCDEATFQNGDINNMITVHFKPDYAIDNLRANNYICHFSVFKRSLLNNTELFRTEYDGSQDHDMILRLTNLAKKVVHVQGIYYYWRAHAGSVASDINAKTYAIDAAKRAVSDHLINCGIYNTSITSSRAFETIFRLKYQVVGEPLVSVIISDDTLECVEALDSYNTYSNIEIIKESDFSDELSGSGFFKKLNYLAAKANGEYLFFLDGNVKVSSADIVKELLSVAQRKDVGAVGGKIINSAGKIEHASVVVGIGKDRAAGLVHHGFDKKYIGYMGRLCYIQDVSALVHDMLMVKKSDFELCGGFVEDYKIAFSDVALCLDLRRMGRLNVFDPYAEGISDKAQILMGSTAEEYADDLKRFKKIYEKEISDTDPYYNKNLTKDSLDYSVCQKAGK